jgi:hypothetical protein
VIADFWFASPAGIDCSSTVLPSVPEQVVFEVTVGFNPTAGEVNALLASLTERFRTSGTITFPFEITRFTTVPGITEEPTIGSDAVTCPAVTVAEFS